MAGSSVECFSIFGDSISTFQGMIPEGNLVYYQGDVLASTGVAEPGDTWWAQVIEHLGGRLLSNASYSGSMVEGAGFPASSSPERVSQLAGSNGQAPDVVLVFMGTNDYGWGGAAAQAAGRSQAAPRCLDFAAVPEAVAGAAGPDALALFARSYDLMLSRLRAAYPNAAVWCLTLPPGREIGKTRPAFAYSLRGVELDAYNRAIADAVRTNGCHLADVRALGFDYEASDGTHPTKRGMRQLAEMTLAAMRGTGSESLPADLFPRQMRSLRWCEEPSCIGCPHARGTGNQWWCVCDKEPEGL